MLFGKKAPATDDKEDYQPPSNFSKLLVNYSLLSNPRVMSNF